MAKPRSEAKQAWQPKLQETGKKGGNVVTPNLDFNKNQTIEELTGGRIKKKS